MDIREILKEEFPHLFGQLEELGLLDDVIDAVDYIIELKK